MVRPLVQNMTSDCTGGMPMVSPVYIWRALVSKQASANALQKPVGSTYEQSAHRLCTVHVHRDAEGNPESFDNVGLGSHVFCAVWEVKHG